MLLIINETVESQSFELTLLLLHIKMFLSALMMVRFIHLLNILELIVFLPG